MSVLLQSVFSYNGYFKFLAPVAVWFFLSNGAIFFISLKHLANKKKETSSVVQMNKKGRLLTCKKLMD